MCWTSSQNKHKAFINKSGFVIRLSLTTVTMHIIKLPVLLLMLMYSGQFLNLGEFARDFRASLELRVTHCSDVLSFLRRVSKFQNHSMLFRVNI